MSPLVEAILLVGPATVAILLLIREIALDLDRAEERARRLQRRLRGKQASIEYLSRSLERVDRTLAPSFFPPHGPKEDE